MLGMIFFVWIISGANRVKPVGTDVCLPAADASAQRPPFAEATLATILSRASSRVVFPSR